MSVETRWLSRGVSGWLYGFLGAEPLKVGRVGDAVVAAPLARLRAFDPEEAAHGLGRVLGRLENGVQPHMGLLLAVRCNVVDLLLVACSNRIMCVRVRVWSCVSC